ncbi:hypothetical protein LCGC14_0698830 [marine sediment metagenome]|uniref:Uncharacterized protein n=1 Tax=marine sediment metagenome TaxID=412755 RepID=A0A0F9QN70_9ZZZZ
MGAQVMGAQDGAAMDKSHNVSCPTCGASTTLAAKVSAFGTTKAVFCLRCDNRWVVSRRAGAITLEPYRTKPVTQEAHAEEFSAYQVLTDIASASISGSWYKIATCTVLVVLDHLDRHLQRRHALEMVVSFVKTSHGDINEGPRQKFLEVCRWFEEHAKEDS